MEAPIILDVEATPTRISKEVDAGETMIERVEERFALKPDHVAGNVAYGTGGMLGCSLRFSSQRDTAHSVLTAIDPN